MAHPLEHPSTQTYLREPRALTRAERAMVLEVERKLLGAFITAHPLEDVWPLVRDQITHRVGQVRTMKPGTVVKVGGVVHSVAYGKTRVGKDSITFNLDDGTDDIFVRVARAPAGKLNITDGAIIVLEAEVGRHDDGVEDSPRFLWYRKLTRPKLPELPQEMGVDEVADKLAWRFFLMNRMPLLQQEAAYHRQHHDILQTPGQALWHWGDEEGELHLPTGGEKTKDM